VRDFIKNTFLLLQSTRIMSKRSCSCPCRTDYYYYYYDYYYHEYYYYHYCDYYSY
jgi:hypothetical protein